jgi:hypothetical protein
MLYPTEFKLGKGARSSRIHDSLTCSDTGHSWTCRPSSILVCDVQWQLHVGGLSLTRSQDYDVRDNQTLPGLQTATNQATAYRYRALHLRPTCLAGLASELAHWRGSCSKNTGRYKRGAAEVASQRATSPSNDSSDKPSTVLRISVASGHMIRTYGRAAPGKCDLVLRSQRETE